MNRILVRFAGNERRQSGYGAERSSVRVDPLPLVIHARSVVTAPCSLGAQPVADRAVVHQPRRRRRCRASFTTHSHAHTHTHTNFDILGSSCTDPLLLMRAKFGVL